MLVDSFFLEPIFTIHRTCVRAMRWLLVLCAITAAAAVLGHALPRHEEWHQWKERHGKVYADEASESARRSTWHENYKLVERHNKDASNHGFTLALNQFADLVSCMFL